MDLKKKVLKTIRDNNLIPDKSSVVLGFSGGPDSSVLLDILASLAMDFKKTNGKFGLDIEIYPVHINHKFRPGDAENDEEYAISICDKLSSKTNGLVKKCEAFEIDCKELAKKEGLTSEEAGRKARYDAFAMVSSRLKNPVIAVAQNANDQAETVLFRILRGTGTYGLSGISLVRQLGETKVVRPLLNVPRTEIEEYVKSHDLNPAIDQTNFEPIYERNKIRLDLIPKLKEYNPNIVESLNRLASNAALDREYFENVSRDELKKATLDDGSLSIEYLDNLHMAIRLRIYNLKLKECGLSEDVSEKALNAIDGLRLSRNHKLATIELPMGYRVSRDKKKLVFYTK